MKLGLIILTWLLFSHYAIAESSKTKEIPSKEDQQKIKQAAGEIAGETKKILRKIGKRSVEEACKVAKADPKKCQIEKKNSR